MFDRCVGMTFPDEDFHFFFLWGTMGFTVSVCPLVWYSFIFRTFFSKRFKISAPNFKHSFILMTYTSSLTFVMIDQFSQELLPFDGVIFVNISVFRTFSKHFKISTQILNLALYRWLTGLVPLLSWLTHSVNGFLPFDDLFFFVTLIVIQEIFLFFAFWDFQGLPLFFLHNFWRNLLSNKPRLLPTQFNDTEGKILYKLCKL